MKSKRFRLALVANVVLAIIALSGGTSVASAASSSSSSAQGVTPTSIKLGITFVNLAVVRQYVNIDEGNFQTAYTAVINHINALGGINGRKIVPYFAAINPIGTAPAATACTELTENDHVFAVLGFFQSPDFPCYITTHNTPLIGGTPSAAQQAQATAPWFNTGATNEKLVPAEMSQLKNQGVFKGHKVGVVAIAADEDELNSLVLPALRKANVPVVQTAINSADASDSVALGQQYGVIAQKFQSEGVDVVIAVGQAGDQWPGALQSNHSTYLPRLIATDYAPLEAYVTEKGGDDPSIMKSALTVSSSPSIKTIWNDPAMKKCVAIVQAAEPHAKINNPVTANKNTAQTWGAPGTACGQVYLFADIVKAAGRNLNNATFNSGGESMTVQLPGGGGSLHFGPGQHAAGPVYLYQWTTQQGGSLQPES